MIGHRWLLLAALAPLTACGLGEKEAFADRVIAAPAAALERGTVAGTIALSVRLVDAPVDLPPGADAASPPLSSPFVADLAAHRSRIEQSHLVHDDLVVHLRRANAKENDARPWLTLDVGDLDDDAGIAFLTDRAYDLPFAAFTMPPAVLVDLIAGALTGSLRSLGADEIDGEPVVGYEARFDLEKMLFDTRDDEYDDDRRDGVEQVFRTLDIPGRVHDGQVWLDGDGLPRRFDVTFIHKPRRRWAFAVDMRVDLEEWGAPVDIGRPQSEETIRISSLTRLAKEILRSFPMPEEDVPAIPTTTTTDATLVTSMVHQ